jgi:dihydrofolate reductase
METIRTIVKGNVADEITKLKQHPGHDILVFGSATLVQSLMEADLIDQYRLLVHPIMMGTGKRSFKDGMATTKLRLARPECSAWALFRSPTRQPEWQTASLWDHLSRLLRRDS